jgi:hypothetical protein
MSVPTQGELKIVIEMPNSTDNGANSGKTPSPANPVNETAPRENPTRGNGNDQAWLATSMNIAKNLGMHAVNSSISTIGLASGNYYAQSQAQKAVSSATSLASYAAMAMSGNWLMLGVSLASSAISSSTELYAQNKEREISNYSAEQYAKRIGYTRDRR